MAIAAPVAAVDSRTRARARGRPWPAWCSPVSPRWCSPSGAPAAAAGRGPTEMRALAGSVRGTGRAVVGVVWAFLVLVLWLWGGGAPGGAAGSSAPTTGDMAAVGRPPGVPMPAAHPPLTGARPQRVAVPALGISAPVVVRGLDARGAIDPPSYAAADRVGWYGAGARPGSRGGAVRRARRHRHPPGGLLRPLHGAAGERIEVTDEDGRTTVFTVDDVRVLDRDRFDARLVYGPREAGRAELRLITCGECSTGRAAATPRTWWSPRISPGPPEAAGATRARHGTTRRGETSDNQREPAKTSEALSSE
ncbi:sortase domain-bontaining protein [Streptomyces zhihengii]